MTYLGVLFFFFCIYLGVLWASWIYVFMSYLNLKKFSVIMRQIFFIFFLFLLIVILSISYTSCRFFHSPWMFHSVLFSVFVLFPFQFLRILLMYPLAQRFFSSVESSLQISPSKVSFVSVTVFLSLALLLFLS